MDTRKKILAFGIDADGVVFNAAFNQAVSALPNVLTLPQKQKMILDQKIAVNSNKALLSWIEDIIQRELPDAVYFISFSNRQDISLDFGNRKQKKNSLFMPVLDQLVQVVSERIQKAAVGKKSAPSIKLLRHLLADLYPDKDIVLRKENVEELKVLDLKGWNIKNKNDAFDSGKLNIFIFMMNLVYNHAGSDFLGESFQIHHHVIDDVATIIQPLYQAIQLHPGFVIQETRASFFLFNQNQQIQSLGTVQGAGQFDVNYETHLPDLFEMAFCSQTDMQMNSVDMLDKNIISAMTDQSARYQLFHYLKYINRDNDFMATSKNRLTESILEALEKSPNRLQAIRSLVEKDADIFKRRIYETGDTLLILFMKKGWFPEAEYLIQLGAEIDMENKFGLCAKDFLPKPSLYWALNGNLNTEDVIQEKQQDKNFVKKKHEKSEEKSDVYQSEGHFEIEVGAISLPENNNSAQYKLKRAKAFLCVSQSEGVHFNQLPVEDFSSDGLLSKVSILGKRARDEWDTDKNLVCKIEEVKKEEKESHDCSRAKKSRVSVADYESGPSFFSTSANAISLEEIKSGKTETTLSFRPLSKAPSE